MVSSVGDRQGSASRIGGGGKGSPRAAVASWRRALVVCLAAGLGSRRRTAWRVMWAAVLVIAVGWPIRG
jgi:hypothetical protein